MLFPCLTLIMIFILFLTYKIKSSDRQIREASAMFWENESKANATRKQSLDSIALITIPLDQLPIMEHANDEILACQNEIQRLAGTKIAHLSDKSNTELKLAYGAANLEILTEYDQNYTELLRALYNWGYQLCEAGFNTEAISVLEFGISCGTDISKHYTLLAEIYKQENTPHKIEDLIPLAEQLDSLMKPAILRSLHHIIDSCHNPG